MAATTAGRKLTNEVYTDRAFLFMVNDLAQADGYTSTADLAVHIFGATDDEEETNARRHAVGSRMAYSVRIGICAKHPQAESDKEHKGRYTITPKGAQLMKGKLTKGVESALKKMTEGDRGLLITQAAKDVFRSDDATAQAFSRRAWEHEFKNRVKSSTNGSKSTKKRSTARRARAAA
jgi:hypothetical protein